MNIWHEKYTSEERNLQVFQIPPREWDVSDNNNLSITFLRDLNGVAKVSDTAANLDLIVKELLERADVENLVGGRLRCVDGEL